MKTTIKELIRALLAPVLLLFTLSTGAQGIEICVGLPEDGPEDIHLFPEFNHFPGSGSVFWSKYRRMENHIPNSETAEKTVHVIFVIYQQDNGSTNWQNTQEHRDRLHQIIDWTNDFYENSDQVINTWSNVPTDPIPGVPLVYDRKLKIKLHDIVYVKDSEQANNTNNSMPDDPEIHNYLKIIIKPRNVIANAFGFSSGPQQNWILTSDDPYGFGYDFEDPPTVPDARPTSIATIWDANLGRWVNYRDYDFAYHLAHEIAHNLGLKHMNPDMGGFKETLDPNAWDFLSDCFNAPWCNPSPCYQDYGGIGRPSDPELSSSDGLTNNIMSSTGRSYFSPLQLGRSHMLLSMIDISMAASGYTTTPLTITQNETWDFSMKLYSDVVVESGATLTIKYTVYMPEEGRIIVKPGGKLIIDGGIITAPGKPSATDWAGIEVRGTNGAPPYLGYQGVLEIKNGGTISYARDAVTNAGWDGNGFMWGTQGGIIDAEDAIFLNNVRDIQLISYHYNSLPTVETDYPAYFRSCTFERDNDYSHPTRRAHISMWDVVGVKILGCTFTDQQDHLSMGIFTLESSYQVNKYQGQPTVFENMERAIYSADAMRADKPIQIYNSEFKNNKFGVYFSYSSAQRVAFNTFEVPVLPVSAGDRPYGIYFDASFNYTFEGNSFTSTSASQNDVSVGAVFNSNGVYANRVYRNTFDGFLVGTEAIGRNRNPQNTEGLVFKCNDFGGVTSNAWDVFVPLTSPPQFTIDHGIAQWQGFWRVTNPNPNTLANNLFSKTASSIDAENQSNYFFYYYGTGNARYEPFIGQNIGLQQEQVSVTYETHCPEKLSAGGGPSELPNDLIQRIGQTDGELSGKWALRGQLIDGGSTPRHRGSDILFREPAGLSGSVS